MFFVLLALALTSRNKNRAYDNVTLLLELSEEIYGTVAELFIKSLRSGDVTAYMYAVVMFPVTGNLLI